VSYFVILFIALLMAIPLCALVYAWRADDSVSPGAVVTGIIVYAALVSVVTAYRGTNLSHLAMGGVIAVYLLAPLYLRFAERGSLKRMIAEDIDKYQRTISFDPRNAAAHTFLGETYFKQRRFDEAIEELETAIQLMPDHSAREKSLLRQVIEAQAREAVKMIRCEHCRKEIAALSRACPCCGGNPRESFFHWMARPENMKDVFVTSAVCMAVIGILVSATRMLPPPLLGVLIVATVIVGGVVLYRSY